MLLADLAPKPAPPPQINVKALQMCLYGANIQEPPGTALETLCALAAQFYADMANAGHITVDGRGTGQVRDESA